MWVPTIHLKTDSSALKKVTSSLENTGCSMIINASISILFYLFMQDMRTFKIEQPKK
jgi:hypothetical protein